VKRTLTRRSFLKVAGAGAAGTALLGASGCVPGGEPEMNVVLIIIDSLRKDHVGAYGNGWIQTPNLDALAKESLRFTRAYPESLPTICARRAIHTGIRTFPFKDRPSEQASAPVYGWLPIPLGQPTLAETLEAAGYQTMLVTDTYHQFRPPMDFSRGFDAYHWIRGQEKDLYKPPLSLSDRDMREQYLVYGEAHKARQYLANTRDRETEEDWFAPKVFLRATEFLEGASKREPFFLVVDSYDPHEPWDPPDEYTSLYDDPYDGPEPFTSLYGAANYLTERQLRRMRALYAGEVTMMDRWLGRFMDKMEELGLFENTLLVLLSDHGHALGEHGYTGKPHYALWPELTDIPFLIRHPGGKGAGETSDDYASTHDVAPTVLGFLGIEPERPMDGQDLSVIFDGGKDLEPRPHFTLGYSEFVWARDEGYAMFGRNSGTRARLYDLSADPKMDEDVAAAHPDVVRRMFDEYVLGDAGGPLPTY
jgi:arylsulfatase A-like enzyme